MNADATGPWRDAPPTRSTGVRRSKAPFARVFTLFSRLSTRGRTVAVFEALSANGRLFRPFIAYNARLMPFGKLRRADTEALILRVAWTCGSRYEWGQHVPIARSAGMTEAEIEAIKGDDWSALPENTCVMLRATDELLGEHVISDETWDQLRVLLKPSEIIELGLLVGHYAALAGVLNSFGVQLEGRTARNAGL